MRRRLRPAFLVVAAASSGAAFVHGCSATSDTRTATSGTGGLGGTGGAGTSTSSGKGGTGGDIIIMHPDAGDAASDAVEDVMQNQCGTKCGPVELCDPEHTGLDDDCNGLVDEGCPCTAGQAHFCFKGDPSYHGEPGCYDGTEICSEQGIWGDCIGGVHATPPDNCYNANPDNCHPITAAPFADVHLKDGTGNFSLDAIPGSETWTVTCPPNVNPCPGVTLPDSYKPLQSGEYSVTYTKSIPANPNDPDAGTTQVSCTYPLFVGAPGLRVELSWEHTALDDGVDLDLHVHEPNSILPWGITPAKSQDCTWSNCTIEHYQINDPASPHWFADPPALPPTPVNWYLDPMFQNNGCFFAPRGKGAKWQSFGMGCHNPRLDLDNIYCDYDVSDPDDDNFCAPENINIDFPPNGQWIRIGVHYYSNRGKNYEVHPEVKVFCNGALAADLGPGGFYTPETPVTFSPSDGSGAGGNRFWVVADVIFKNDQCNKTLCTVQPVYSNPAGKTPFFILDSAATSVFAPNYPPIPP